MDEIHKNSRGLYQANNSEGNLFENLIRRLEALNREFFNDNVKKNYYDLLNDWKIDEYDICDYFDEMNLDEIERKTLYCLCGHKIYNIYKVKRNDDNTFIGVQLGSDCIGKFRNNKLDKIVEEEKKRIIKEKNKNKRTTFDCDICGKKRIKYESNHGKCKDCDVDIECKYTKCYNCRFKEKTPNKFGFGFGFGNEYENNCITCGKKIKNVYTKCYECNFKIKNK